jgi:phosphoribosylformylglycinamidine synthase
MDGNYFADSNTLKSLEDNSQIAFRYCDESGQISEACNPNGAANNIAGIFNKTKNILGMMPHPERAIDKETGLTDGLLMFKGILNLF